MREEEARLIAWKLNLIEAAKYLEEERYCGCGFKIGFTLQGIMIAIGEMERENNED